MSGFDVVVLIFLCVMTIGGIAYEIDKRKNRKQMKNLLSSESPWSDSSPGAAGLISEYRSPSSSLALRNLEKIQESTRLIEQSTKLIERQMDAATALPEDEFNRQLKQLEDAKAKSDAESYSMAETAANIVLTNEFTAEDSFLSDLSATGIAINPLAKKIALLTSYGRTVLSYSDIVSSEVEVDSETVIKTDRLGQIGGAVLGGVVTGGIGALVMAMGAKKKQIANIRRVELKVLTTSTERPIHNVRFYEKSQWSSPNVAVNEAEKWHDLLTVAIHAAKREIHPPISQSTLSPSWAMADELRKLALLKAEGLLTDEEFALAKARLL